MLWFERDQLRKGIVDIYQQTEILFSSPEETFAFGKAFAKRLPDNALLTFFGDLGSGKTTFIKGIIEEITGISERWVQSPTFVTLNIYQNDEKTRSVYHFDLYRLNDYAEFAWQGFEEYFFKGICCIEWSEKLLPFLPTPCFKIYLEHICDNQRKIVFKHETAKE